MSLRVSPGPFTYEWRKGGALKEAPKTAAQAGSFGSLPPYWEPGTKVAETSVPELVIPKAKASDAGYYDVVVRGTDGTMVSNEFHVSVRSAPPRAPSVIQQPTAVAATVGSRIELNVVAAGSPAPAIQWQKDGSPIPGATSATLVIPIGRIEDAGTYRAVLSNASGAVTSSAATVTVGTSRLVNLSVLSDLEQGEILTLGAVAGGGNGAGTIPVLVRAIGPSLSRFGISTPLGDPWLRLMRGQQEMASNDNWGGTPELESTFARVGAFALSARSSLDSALHRPDLAAGPYTVQVRGLGNGTGTVLAELYDTSSGGVTAGTSARLVNVSVLKQLRAGTNITAGFVISGAGPKRVLIRAVGPALGRPPFNITGTMADPLLTLFAGQKVVATNDNWSNQASGASVPQLGAAFDSVGAFRLLEDSSRDAVLFATLDPGSYTAQVTGSERGAGLVLIEVYEVP